MLRARASMKIGGARVYISVSRLAVVDGTTCAVDKLRRPFEAHENCLSADVHRDSVRRTAPEQRQFERE